MLTKTQAMTLFLAVSLLCTTGGISEGKDADQHGAKPNVLFIAIDDMNDWNGVLKGNPQAKTPHMEQLASKGMVFSNAHCAAPACGPSRSAIMSGIRPSTSGNYINKNSLTRNPILNNSVLMPEFFQQNGYYVAGVGKLFHGGHFQREVKGRWAKYSLWERATRVNLMWVAPGVITPGTVTDKPVNLLDIYPTLASLTGLEPPKGQLEGNDLSILMKDPNAAWTDTTVTSFGYKNYGVRSDRYRYIVYEDGTEELYDHAKDKWEWTNLADNPEYAAIKKKMRKEIPTHHEPVGAIEAFFESRRK